MKLSIALLFVASVLAHRRPHSEAFDGSAWLSSIRSPNFDIKLHPIEDVRRIKLSEGSDALEMSTNEVDQLIMAHKTRFIDVTHRDLSTFRPSLTKRNNFVYPKVEKNDKVEKVLTYLNQTRLPIYVEGLSSIYTRYYNQTGGVQAADLIYSWLSDIAEGQEGIEISYFEHPWPQPSVIVHINGTSDDQTLTIGGGHLDSINTNNITGRAGGADDNASGVANLIDSFHAIVASGFKPKTPIEFHFYAAEEIGLKGSQDIAYDYLTQNISIKAMLNLDMSAYVQPGTNFTMGWVSDLTSPVLTAFGKEIAETYVSGYLNVTDDFCGYACTDHASFTYLGFPAANPYEGITETGNPNNHDETDLASVEGFSYEHMQQFSEMLTAFLVTLTM